MDSISRQAAIEIVEFECGGELIGTAKIITKRLSDLPSAQPTQTNTSNALNALDCVSRQAAIDTIDEYDFEFPNYMGRFVTELRDAMKADLKDDIEALPSAQPEQRWIPVTERVPKKSGQYYVSGGDKVWICEFLIIPNFFTGGWCNDVANPVVRAWMPLPEPWKEGENQ